MADAFVSRTCRGLVALLPPERLLIAVSGGQDSMALLDALHAGRSRRGMRHIEFVVGHFDHGLRSDSARDAELVAQAAQDRGWALAIRRASSWGTFEGGLEQAARKARYGALTEMASEHGCGGVVTAHTATDQAETLLWNLARGAGRRGLGAMRSRTRMEGLLVLRPLLGVTREDTAAYCARRGIVWADDPTNADQRPRARLRAEVIPVLERLAPGAVRRIAEAARRLREDDDWLEAEAVAQLGARPDRAVLRSLPTPLRRRAMVRWVEARTGSRRRLSSRHIEALDRLVETGAGSVDLPAASSTRQVAVVVDGVLDLRALARDESQGPWVGAPAQRR